MKKLFTTPIRLLAAAGVLASVGAAASYALGDTSDTSAAPAKAPVFKAPERLKDVEVLPTYVTVNGFRLEDGGTYYIARGRRMGLWNRTEMVDGYSKDLGVFISENTYNYDSYHPLGVPSSFQYSEYLINPNGVFGTSSPNKSIYWDNVGKAPSDPMTFNYGIYSSYTIYNDIPSTKHGTVNIGTATIDNLPLGVYVNDSQSSINTYATLKKGSKITVKGPEDNTATTTFVIWRSVPVDMRSGNLVDAENNGFSFTLSGIPGHTYTFECMPRDAYVSYGDLNGKLNFDITIAPEEISKAPGVEVDGIALTPGSNHVGFTRSTKISITNPNEFKGEGYSPEIYAIGAETGTRYSLSDLQFLPTSTTKNQYNNTLTFYMSEKIKENLTLYVSFKVESGAAITTNGAVEASYSIKYKETPELPKVYVDGQEVQSGCEVMSGSLVEFRNPNDKKWNNTPLSEVRTYVLPQSKNPADKGTSPSRTSFLNDYVWDGTLTAYNYTADGNVAFTAGAPTSDFVTVYIGTENGYNITDAQLSRYYNMKESTFKFKIVPRTVEAPYVTATNGITLAFDGMFALRGTELKVVNPNTFVAPDKDKPAAYLVATTNESWNQYALASPTVDSSNGEITFKVGGEHTSIHTLRFSYLIDSSIQSYFKLPDSGTSFTFTTTNVLPMPIVNVEDGRYQVLAGEAEGLDGVKVVRANLIPGTHVADAAYDYIPNDDWTGSDPNKFYAAYLHGDGYITSEPIFWRTFEDKKTVPADPIYYINGEEQKDVTKLVLNLGDELKIENPNWYALTAESKGINEIKKYFVADLELKSATDMHFIEDKEAGTFTTTITEDLLDLYMYLRPHYSVKENCERAFTTGDATQMTIRTVADLVAPYFTLDGNKLAADVKLYDAPAFGLPFTFVNPNTNKYQAAQLTNPVSSGNLLGLGTYDSYGNREGSLASFSGEQALEVNLKTTVEFNLPKITNLHITNVGDRPEFFNGRASNGGEALDLNAIPYGSAVWIDLKRDASYMEGNYSLSYTTHIDVVGRENTYTGNSDKVSDFIAKEGSVNVALNDGNWMDQTNYTTFTLCSPIDEAVEIEIYLTDDEGRLATNKYHTTIKATGTKLEQPSMFEFGGYTDLTDGVEADLFLGSRFTYKNPNDADHQTLKVMVSKDGAEALPIEDVFEVSNDPYSYDGTRQFFLTGGEHTYVFTMTIEVDSELAGAMQAPDPVVFTVHAIKRTIAPFEVNVNWSDPIDGVYYLQAGDFINVTRPSSAGTNFVPVFTLDGVKGANNQATLEPLFEDYYTAGRETEFYVKEGVSGTHTLIMNVEPKDGDFESYNLPEPVEIKLVIVDKVLEAPYVTVNGQPLMPGDAVENWSDIHFVNPNDVEGSFVTYSAIGNEDFDLADYAYENNVTDDGNGGFEFTLLGNDTDTMVLTLDATAFTTDGKTYGPARTTVMFSVKNRKLSAPNYTYIQSGMKYYNAIEMPNDLAVHNITAYWMHANITDGQIKSKSGNVSFANADGKHAIGTTDYVSSSSEHWEACYIAAPGCYPSEVVYGTAHGMHHGYTHDFVDATILVNREEIDPSDESQLVVKPGDVIEFVNPYVFEIGEYSAHCPVDHDLQISASDSKYMPTIEDGTWLNRNYIGHHVIIVPGEDQGAPAAVAQRRAPRAAQGSISFTSTLKPMTEHASAFNASEPKTYTFTVDDEAQTGVEEISAEELLDAEIYTISGVRVTTVENLAPGFYIIVRGNTSEKVLIK